MRKAPFVTWIAIFGLAVSICSFPGLGRRASAQSPHVKSQNQYPVLSRYAIDLTSLALAGKLEMPRAREHIVDSILNRLSASPKAPVIVADADLTRDEIMRGVALRLAFGEVPENLSGKRVFSLSLDAVAKDARTSDDRSLVYWTC